VLQEKAKPVAKQGRKITGLREDSRVALKKVARLFIYDIDRYRDREQISGEAAVILLGAIDEIISDLQGMGPN
jgi:hypothetical protein